MASPHHKSDPPVAHFQATIRRKGSNNKKRAAAWNVSQQTIQNLLTGRRAAILKWLATEPEACLALAVDALRNSPALDWPAYNAIEEQLAEFGRLLEEQADEIHADALEAAAQLVDAAY